MKNISFLSENFSVFGGKIFSIYLNRRVFEMISICLLFALFCAILPMRQRTPRGSNTYSRFFLSRLRLIRITTYFEVKSGLF